MNPIPKDPTVWMSWTWADFEPYAADLLERPLTADTLESWMSDWTRLSETIDELYQRLYVAQTSNTADAQIERRYNEFLDGVFPHAMQSEQSLKEKLLASGLEPGGFEIQVRNMRAEAALFRVENLPLLAEEQKLNAEYDQIIGAQTVEWEGKEVTVSQLDPVYLEPDRERREQAWRLATTRQLADRGRINELWGRFYELRRKLAANAGQPDYRAYRWRQLLRFDYTPDDSLRFGDAIAEAVVPVATRLYEKRRQRLGLDRLRPWDTDVDPDQRSPLKPYTDSAELPETTARIFHQVDPELGSFFDRMMRDDLLDLDNRKNKAPGGYCTFYPQARVPFIFANSVGVHDDVQTLLHEGGHAFHAFESASLPYYQQLAVPMEFAEVASMGMELLAAPYLASSAGGFYTEADAGRALVEHLQRCIAFWPYMAVVDGFQHWAYTHPQAGSDPQACDQAWTDLWRRFMPGVDWTGLEAELETGWHRKMHIHQVPFYYVEYGLAQLGAVQVWRNAKKDQAGAVADYRRALALGGTRPLPELFKTAGARLAFDADTLRDAVSLMEETIGGLEEGN